MRPFLCLILAGLLPAIGHAAESVLPTTLSGYLNQAQQANPDLRAYAARHEAARERIPQAAALPDPTLQITHFVESVQTRTGPQENILMLNQRLPWFGRLSGRERAASAEAEAVHYAWQARQLRLAREVGTGFYDYAYTGRAIALTAQNLALLERLAPQVEERTRSGGEFNALLRLQVELGRLRDRLAALEETRAQQSARLAAQLALPVTAPLPEPVWEPDPAATGDPIEPTALFAAIDTQNPELLALERKIESAAARAALARLESRPDFTLGLTYIQIGSPTVNPTTPDAGRDPWGVTFAVNLPVWNQRTAAAKRESVALQRAATGELEDRRNGLRGEALAALSAEKDAQRRLQLYRQELLPLARQAVENTLAAYEGNRATLLELIDSERSLLDLELQLWRAHADAARQRLVLLTLANQPL
jgi:outer membrane protein TolC